MFGFRQFIALVVPSACPLAGFGHLVSLAWWFE
jgi:hypothetical protein